MQGDGVFLDRAASAGSVLLHLDDSRIVDDTHPLRPDDGEAEHHRDFLPDGTVVLMPAPECFINHSCDPNCFVYSVNRQRFLLAKRAIAAGEELFMDYALNAVGGDLWECRCGAANCRGRRVCDFFALPVEVQRANLPYLDPWFAEVHAGRIQALLRGGAS